MNLKKFLPLLVSAIFFMPAQIQAAPMTLSVHEADLRSTIMLVAKNGGLNVSVDDSVKGTISISVENVEPLRLLEIISRTKSLQLIQEAGIYIMTASSVEVMQSYVFPIRYGDAETLRDAVIMSLDPDTERLPNSTTRIRNADGSYTYRYTYRNDDSDDYNDFDNVKRKDRVYINPEVNALVLYGTPAEYERVKNLLATLDVELKQVSVEAKILAIDKNESKNLGVEWMWSTIPQNPEYSNYTPPVYDYDENGNVISYTPGYYGEKIKRANSYGENGYGIIRFGRNPSGFPYEFYYGAKINALVTDGKAKILSRPNVMTIQGREAVINVGSSVPVPKISSTNTATTTEIEYRDAGIILRYTPRINADGTITAKIHTEVSTPQYVADMGAYRFNTRSAETTVTVRDGEPMVIGGLIGAEEEKSVSKIPFLGDLPLLGALFRNHRKSKSESELIIFLTAHVLGGNSNEILSIKP
ncbi:MAG: type II secretion system protein GspD [Selenomonadaceae bacterium]|nr:type II secretion system protein GspD [Selenomonadaceae bacterium]